MVIPGLCWVFWINSWATFVSYCSAKPGLRGWPLLDPNSILSLKSLLFWTIKGEMQCIPWKSLALPALSLTPLFVCRTCCWEPLMFVLLHLPRAWIWHEGREPFPKSLKHLGSISILWLPRFSCCLGKQQEHSRNDRDGNAAVWKQQYRGKKLSFPSSTESILDHLLFFICW